MSNTTLKVRWYLKCRDTGEYRVFPDGHLTTRHKDPKVKVFTSDGSTETSRWSHWVPWEPCAYPSKEEAFASRARNCCPEQWVVVRRQPKGLISRADSSVYFPPEESERYMKTVAKQLRVVAARIEQGDWETVQLERHPQYREVPRYARELSSQENIGEDILISLRK